MLKKILVFIIITLISIQIPLAVSLSTVRQITTKLEGYQSKIENTAVPVKAATQLLSVPAKAAKGLFSIFKKVPVVNKVPLVSQLGDMASVLAGGESSLKDAMALTKQMTKVMYLNIFLILFLMILLFFLSRKCFIKNLGYSFLIDGLIGLILLALIYYFFVFNFNKTFDFFYAQTGSAGSKRLIPFMSNITKSFSKDFIKVIVNSVITRNIISALISMPFGIVLIFLNKYFSKKFNVVK